MVLYRCGGGESSTPITPSNSNPAALTANTSVKPTTNGYAIASYDSVTPSSTPESVASGDIVKIGGSGVIVDAMPPTPASITPSNATPAALTANTVVKPTANGYAIAAYSSVTPSNSSPVVLTSGDIDKMGGNGYAIESFNTITPSNATPVSLADGDVDRINGNGYAIASYSTKTPSNSTPVSLTSGEIDKMGGNGYAIASYSTVTPSGIPTSVSSGDIVKIDGGFNDIVVDMSDLHEIRGSNTAPEAMNGGALAKVWGNDPTVVTGYAIASYTPVTPSSTPTSISTGDMVQVKGSGTIVDAVTSITPSNSSPVSLSSGSFYKPSASGYAISSYSSKTPSDTSPASVSSGAIIKASSVGYLVKNTPVNLGAPDVISQANMSGNTSRNITVTKTPRYIIFILVRANDTSGRNYCTCYDVGKDTYTYEYYGGDGYAKTETASGKPSLITTVSSTTVTVNNTVASTCRSHVLIYY